MEMNIFTHVILLILFLIYLVVNTVLGVRRKKRQAESGSALKSSIEFSKRAIRKQAISTAVFLVIVLITSISFYDIGFRALSFPYNLWFTVITLILSGTVLVYSLVQLIGPLASEKYRQKIKKLLNKESYKLHRSTLPCNKKERLWWVGCSMGAGISEEIVSRGFLFYLLFAIFPDVSPVIIVVAASAVFGLGHLYQGIQGVITTAAGGALLGCLYLVTGSLIPGILLHFFTDVANVFLLSDQR